MTTERRFIALVPDGRVGHRQGRRRHAGN
jgi:hypothetical protein